MAQTVTTINELMFVSELSRLTFRTDNPDCTFAIVRNGQEVFKQSYVADSNNLVTIYDLDRLLDTLIADIYDSFTFLVSGTALGCSNVKVFKCNAAVAEPAKTFIPDFFLTASMGERDTTPERYEVVTLYTDTETPVQAICTYVGDDLTVTTVNENITSLLGWSYIDVSPSRFMKPEKGTLVAYTIQAGKRKAHFRVHPSLPEAEPAVIFRNCFHAWETLYLTGAMETSGNYTRSSAIVGGQFRIYDIEETLSYKAQTGPLRPGAVPVAMDLARSKEVFLLNADGTVGDEIAITAVENKHTNEDDHMPDFSFTYRRVDRRNTMIAVERPPRIFDKTFDETYE